MSWSSIIGLAFATCVVGSASYACSFVESEATPDGLRAQSQPVTQDRMCRTINIGVDDRTSLGPVNNLGNGRIMQVINENLSQVYLADCNTREATILIGTPTLVGETSCGPYFTHADLWGDDAMMSLKAGDDLHALVAAATAAGARERNPLKRFFEFDIFYSAKGFNDDYDVSPKDRFDLMCGCKKLYPNSAGASQ